MSTDNRYITKAEMLQHLSDHFNMTMADLIATMNAPTHPHGLRDDFALAAMQAMLSSPNCPRIVDEKELARQAFFCADAMLEARK